MKKKTVVKFAVLLVVIVLVVSVGYYFWGAPKMEVLDFNDEYIDSILGINKASHSNVLDQNAKTINEITQAQTTKPSTGSGSAGSSSSSGSQNSSSSANNSSSGSSSSGQTSTGNNSSSGSSSNASNSGSSGNSSQGLNTVVKNFTDGLDCVITAYANTYKQKYMHINMTGSGSGGKLGISAVQSIGQDLYFNGNEILDVNYCYSTSSICKTFYRYFYTTDKNTVKYRITNDVNQSFKYKFTDKEQTINYSKAKDLCYTVFDLSIIVPTKTNVSVVSFDTSNSDYYIVKIRFNSFPPEHVKNLEHTTGQGITVKSIEQTVYVEKQTCLIKLIRENETYYMKTSIVGDVEITQTTMKKYDYKSSKYTLTIPS